MTISVIFDRLSFTFLTGLGIYHYFSIMFVFFPPFYLFVLFPRHMLFQASFDYAILAVAAIVISLSFIYFFGSRLC